MSGSFDRNVGKMQYRYILQFRLRLKRLRFQYRYRNSVLVTVPDTDTEFQSDTTVPLTRISCNTILSKSQNARQAGTLCTGTNRHLRKILSDFVEKYLWILKKLVNPSQLILSLFIPICSSFSIILFKMLTEFLLDCLIDMHGECLDSNKSLQA